MTHTSSVGLPKGQLFPADPTCVGYWKLIDNLNGATITDRSGNGNTGTLYGSPVYTGDSKFGKSLTFDGVDDYVNAGNGASLQLTDFTVSMWVKFDTLNRGIIISKGRGIDNGGTINAGWYIAYDSADGNNMRIEGSDTSSFVSFRGAIKSTGIFYHFVLTKSNISMKLYTNSILEGSSNLAPSGSIDDPNEDLQFGRSSFGYNFNGVIDNVRIYNRALSESEILDHYNRGR